MKVLEGNYSGRGLRIGIIAARFNEFITSKLIGGAEDALVRHEVAREDIELAWVPGAFEIPLVAKKMAKSGKYDAVITLGAVIKGSTPHFDYVCMGATQGITELNATGDIPVIYGLITTNTMEQAEDRAGGKLGNKGDECAITAIKMIDFVWSLNK